MNVITCNRNDLGLLLHKPIALNTDFKFGNYNPMIAGNYQSALTGYVQDLNAFYQSDAYIQRANELLMYKEDNYLDMSIYIINSIDQFIGIQMQQYIMACPQIAQAYDDGLINGFTHGYQHDYYLPYTERKNYEEVMDGIVYDAGEEDMYVTKIQREDDEEGLSWEDQDKIQITWDYVRSLLSKGQDPTELQETIPTT